MDLKHKIELAIKLLQSIPQDGPIELSYSGGKDSDVILELAKMSGIPFEPIYKNTTIDPPGTIAHCYENGVTVVKPRVSFQKLLETKGMPSRWHRFCCSELKEYKIYDRAIQGIRRSESSRRAKLYKEPEECRVYPNREKVRVYFPILEWTDKDVEQFICDRKIKCAPIYYDENGQFHVERRLGCIGCPLKSDLGLAEYRQYPKLLKAHIKAYQTFLDNHRDKKFALFLNGSAYNGFFYRLFCRSNEQYLMYIGGGLFPDQAIDTKKFLEEHFGCEL